MPRGLRVQCHSGMTLQPPTKLWSAEIIRGLLATIAEWYTTAGPIRGRKLDKQIIDRKSRCLPTEMVGRSLSAVAATQRTMHPMHSQLDRRCRSKVWRFAAETSKKLCGKRPDEEKETLGFSKWKFSQQIRTILADFGGLSVDYRAEYEIEKILCLA